MTHGNLLWIWNHLPDRHLQNCSSVLPVVVAQEGHVGQEQLFHLKKREVARVWCYWQRWWWWWWSCRITNKTVVCLCIRPNKRTFDMMWRWIDGIPLFFFNRGLSGLCRKYCPVKFSWQRTYEAAHPQAFVSCLKALFSEESIFCIDCFELRLEMIRSSSVTFFSSQTLSYFASGAHCYFEYLSTLQLYLHNSKIHTTTK